MKKFFSKLPLLCLLAVLCGMLLGCDPTKSGKFSVSVKEVGSSYVDLEFTGPEVIDIIYILSTKNQIMNNVTLIAEGDETTVAGGDVLRLTSGITEDTQYYIYLATALDDYTEIYKLEFKTSTFEFTELITVLDTQLDGYRMRITIPEETKERQNAIRWNSCDLMMYNYMETQADDYMSLLRNGGSVENATTKDTTLVYSEGTNVLYMDDTDGDGEPDMDFKYNPISPGEPVVFIAGEFSYMEDSPEYETETFKYPSGWDPGYYMPLLDPSYYGAEIAPSSVGIINDDMSRPMDDYWTGAFQRKTFRIQEPELLDGGVEVKLAKATPIDLHLEFYPDDNVYQYAVGIFDDAMYGQILELLNGNEDYMQWAMTSYFAAYTFGTKIAQDAVQMNLSTFYYQDAISEDTDYHVLVTAIGDEMATSQSFQKYTFRTKLKTKDAPVIEVTALPESNNAAVEGTTAYKAMFNIKCTTAAEGNPVTECYYAANYLRDWILAVNGGSTYHSLVAGNKESVYNTFSEDELELINSEDGYNIAIESIDGETTRLVVLGYNDEYTANDLLSFSNIEDCPAVADCTTPYSDPKKWVNPKYYSDLVDVWTATATLSNSEGSKSFKHTSKIDLRDNLDNYPETLTSEVYKIYEKAETTKEEVDAMWVEFKNLSTKIAEERLVNQNRLVGLGWLDEDSYDRLEAHSPYDLFIDEEYSSVDVSSLFNDYGPKWYLETEIVDGEVKYFIPIDSNKLPPASSWSVPFTLAAYDMSSKYAFTYGQDWTPSFPVTVSADRNTITIHPLVYDGVKYYPNMIGIDSKTGNTILENPVISEIVLTRGWEESEKKQSSVAVPGRNAAVSGDFSNMNYKARTRLKASAPLPVMEGSVMTVDQFRKNADRLVEKMYK